MKSAPATTLKQYTTACPHCHKSIRIEVTEDNARIVEKFPEEPTPRTARWYRLMRSKPCIVCGQQQGRKIIMDNQTFCQPCHAEIRSMTRCQKDERLHKIVHELVHAGRSSSDVAKTFGVSRTVITQQTNLWQRSLWIARKLGQPNLLEEAQLECFLQSDPRHKRLYPSPEATETMDTNQIAG